MQNRQKNFRISITQFETIHWKNTDNTYTKAIIKRLEKTSLLENRSKNDISQVPLAVGNILGRDEDTLLISLESNECTTHMQFYDGYEFPVEVSGVLLKSLQKYIHIILHIRNNWTQLILQCIRILKIMFYCKRKMVRTDF